MPPDSERSEDERLTAPDLTSDDVWFSAWSGTSELDQLAPEEELRPGLRVLEARAFHTRLRTPEGARYVPRACYGRPSGGGDLNLWLYARSSPDERAPGVVFVHGGGFTEGHPFIHIRQANQLAAQGYVTATIAYRMAPQARWPDFLEDAKCAVRWLRARSEQIGLDPTRVAMVGGSAGGYLAAMVALTPGLWEGDGGHPEQSSAIQAAVLYYPGTDLRLPGGPPNAQRDIGRIFGLDQDALYRASPIAHVSGSCPPILTITGEADDVTPVGMIRRFHDRLTESGVVNELRVFSAQSHAFDFYPPMWQTTYDVMSEFLDRQLDLQRITSLESEELVIGEAG